jgi:hypothetical protein
MTDFQRVVLEAVNSRCSIDSGYATGGLAMWIGRQPGHETNRQHSALVGKALRDLHGKGLVGLLDDKKPPIWCRKGA